jgi:plastocyanin
MMRRSMKTLTIVGMTAVLVVAVGAVAFTLRDNQEPRAYGSEVIEVELGPVSFEPGEIEIPVGTTVRFVNGNDIEHDIAQTTPDQVHHDEGHGHDDEDTHGHNDEDRHGHEKDKELDPIEVSHGFHSPHLQQKGDAWEARFTEAGIYPILCTVNDHYKAGMIGTIVVTEF